MRTPDEPRIPAYLYRLYPELRFFETRTELRAAKVAFRKQALGKSRGVLALIALGAGTGTISVLGFREASAWGLPFWSASLIQGVVSVLCGGIFGFYFWRRPYTRFLRRYLQGRGIAVCLKCGYDLRGQVEAHCPECGLAFDEKLLTHGGGQ